MCFYYNINKGKTSSLVKNKVIKIEQAEVFPEMKYANGFEHPVMPVLTDALPGQIQNFAWGYVPENVSGKKQINEFLNSYNTLNARNDKIFDGKLFGEAVNKRRCLVFCSGFFEWQHIEVPGKIKPEKIKYYITMSDEEMFVMGGLWNSVTDKYSGETVSTYTIITTEANEMMAEIHNTKKRMPFILSPEMANEWLNNKLGKEEIKGLIKPFDPEKMKAARIG